MNYTLTTAILGLAGGVALFLLVRRNILYVRYSLWWIAVAVGIALLGLFPKISDTLAAWAGVSYPPTLILVVAIFMLLLKILFMDIERSRQEARTRRLVQRMAMLQAALAEHRAGRGDEAARILDNGEEAGEDV